jgi:outer membrane protein
MPAGFPAGDRGTLPQRVTHGASIALLASTGSAPVAGAGGRGGSGFDQVAGARRVTLSGVGVPEVPAARHATPGRSRKQQSVIFAVQKAYFALDASRARVTARETALKAATAVEQATGIRSRGGLASITDTLLARQVVLQQQFDIASAQRDVHAAEAQLAQAIGISPASLPQVASLSSLPLPQGLPTSVDSLLQQAVSTRPDLAAKFADVRAREAELDRARADYLPKLSANGTLGRVYRELDSLNLGPNGTTFYPQRTTWSVGLQLSWELFDGFIRDNRVREAKARRDQARADLDALQLASQAEVWTAYADFQSGSRAKPRAAGADAADRNSKSSSHMTWD